MDALLTRTAYQALEAAALSSRRTSSGLLLGHKRGRRFIIEKTISSGSGPFPGMEDYFRLNSILGDEVIGFYSSAPGPALRQKDPPPFSVGKVFLSIKAGRAGCRIRASAIDYTDRFVWKPLRLALPGGKTP